MSVLSDILEALRAWPKWKRIEELPERVDDLAERVRELEERLKAPRGQFCPRCNQPTFMVMETKPDPIFGPLGGRRHVMRCATCEFTEEQQVR